MATARGLTFAFGLFAGMFALHVVGGASGQRWLFAIAVVGIYVSATGFPAFATWFAGAPSRVLLAVAAPAGVGLTASALWATNARAFAWWEIPAAATLVALSTGTLLVAWRPHAERGPATASAA